MTVDVREHGDKSDPDYQKYHPNSDTRQRRSFAPKGWNAPYRAEERTAVWQYTSDVYRDLNAMLRGRELEMEANPDQLRQIAAKMQAALRPSPEPLDVFRGTSFSAFSEVLGGRVRQYDAEQVMGVLQGKIGTVFTDKGFMSTSLTTDLGQYQWREVRLFLHAPAGTPSIMAAEESKFKQEREVILAPGTRWRLDSVKMVRRNATADGVEVHGTVVP